MTGAPRDDGAPDLEAHLGFGAICGVANPRHVTYPLERANDALADLRAGRVRGAAVLVM